MRGVYVQQVAGGDNLAGRDDLSDDMICQYLQAANVAMRFHFNLLVPVFMQGNGSMQSDRLDPYLSEILASHRNWKRPIPKKGSFQRTHAHGHARLGQASNQVFYARLVVM
jgi:hypothetical protein